MGRELLELGVLLTLVAGALCAGAALNIQERETLEPDQAHSVDMPIQPMYYVQYELPLATTVNISLNSDNMAFVAVMDYEANHKFKNGECELGQCGDVVSAIDTSFSWIDLHLNQTFDMVDNSYYVLVGNLHVQTPDVHISGRIKFRAMSTWDAWMLLVEYIISLVGLEGLPMFVVVWCMVWFLFPIWGIVFGIGCCCCNSKGRTQGPKNMCCGYSLWFFLGVFGAHRFYYRRWITGILWLLTGGLFGVGWLIDGFFVPSFTDKSNVRLRPTTVVINPATSYQAFPSPYSYQYKV